MAKTGVIILNYNGADDTIECVSSLLELNTPSIQIVIVDNASTDNSVEKLKEWHKEHKLELIGESEDFKKKDSSNNNSIYFIQSESNNGFAAGNNLGVKLALADPSIEYFWILNNDTVVDSAALDELIKHHNSQLEQRKSCGIIGSKLRFYNERDKLQGLGANFNPWLAKSTLVGSEQIDTNQFENTELKLDYVIGASLFISRKTLMEIGLLSEDYFLYCEELDWALRAKNKGFEVSCAPSSIVYHKQGMATGNKLNGKKSKRAMYFHFKSLLRLYRKHYPLLYPIVIAVIFSRIIKFAITKETAFLKLLVPVFFLKQKKHWRASDD